MRKVARERKHSCCLFLVGLIKEMGDSSASSEVLPAVMKRRAACERWKIAHREYYLAQKRKLANRPEYKAHRREMYKERTDDLKLLGILPRKRGRPQMYVGPVLISKRSSAVGSCTVQRSKIALACLHESATQNSPATNMDIVELHRDHG